MTKSLQSSCVSCYLIRRLVLLGIFAFPVVLGVFLIGSSISFFCHKMSLSVFTFQVVFATDKNSKVQLAQICLANLVIRRSLDCRFIN